MHKSFADQFRHPITHESLSLEIQETQGNRRLTMATSWWVGWIE
jgi:hypothetical protein